MAGKKGRSGQRKGTPRHPGTGRRPGSTNHALRPKLPPERIEQAQRMLSLRVAGEAPTPLPLDAMLLVMRCYMVQEDLPGTLAAATAAAPYLHARLSQSDIKVRHSFGDRSDAEIAQELIAIERRLQLAATIEGEPIVAEKDDTIAQDFVEPES